MAEARGAVAGSAAEVTRALEKQRASDADAAAVALAEAKRALREEAAAAARAKDAELKAVQQEMRRVRPAIRREETSGQSPRPHTSFVRMPAIEVLIEVLAAGARATLSAT